MWNPFRRAVRRGKQPADESRDLLDTQLDRLAGGIPYLPYQDLRIQAILRPELPILATRPTDNPDLWF